MTFSFFLSIYSRCGAPASWAARHTTVCLDTNSLPSRLSTVAKFPTIFDSFFYSKLTVQVSSNRGGGRGESKRLSTN